MFARFSSAALLLAGLTSATAAENVEIQKVEGAGLFAIESASVADLSGITWTGGDSFAAVSDRRNVIQFLTLKVDHATGQITSGSMGERCEVPAQASDFEGITWVAAAKTFYLSAEQGNSVIRFAPGATASKMPVPAIFARARRNLGLESLTWNESVRLFWMANEEALQPDGPVSGAGAGTMVRLQKCDAKFRPLAQYAWRTEPAAFRYGNAGSGVSDLCLLPNGQLIVLERGFTPNGLHLRLFLADFTDATDITRCPALEGKAFVPAKKTLLFEESTGFINFEGITLGPALADGWRSLIVVADSNSTSRHSFLALRVRLETQAKGAVIPGVTSPR